MHSTDFWNVTKFDLCVLPCCFCFLLRTCNIENLGNYTWSKSAQYIVLMPVMQNIFTYSLQTAPLVSDWNSALQFGHTCDDGPPPIFDTTFHKGRVSKAVVSSLNTKRRALPGWNVCCIYTYICIDQFRHESLPHNYHYPPFWWSKLLVVRRVKQCANSVHNAHS